MGSRSGAPTMVCQKWRTKIGAPNMVCQKWRTRIGVSFWCTGTGAPVTDSLERWRRLYLSIMSEKNDTWPKPRGHRLDRRGAAGRPRIREEKGLPASFFDEDTQSTRRRMSGGSCNRLHCHQRGSQLLCERKHRVRSQQNFQASLINW